MSKITARPPLIKDEEINTDLNVDVYGFHLNTHELATDGEHPDVLGRSDLKGDVLVLRRGQAFDRHKYAFLVQLGATVLQTLRLDLAPVLCSPVYTPADRTY